jgi:putative toxin-antitoxin system antitoxin component (TIGR02293 family)
MAAPAVRSKHALLEAATGGKLPHFDGRSVEILRQRGFSMDEIYRFVAPRRTLARRIEKNEPLTLAENDSAQRILRISELAERVFGNLDKAQRWLRKPNRSMNGVVPIDLLESETGARLVEDAITRIDYGIYV